MKNFKKHTAYFFVWIAILTIVTHGIIPHHHHVGLEEFHYQCQAEGHAFEKECHHPNHIFCLEHNTETNETCSNCYFKPVFSFNQFVLSVDQVNESFSFNCSINNSVRPVFSKGYYAWYKYLLVKKGHNRGPPSIV